ncbi:hypothetical protein TRFO_08339 [Tritrichomonas foetus]|uniref:EF hand family protein n=1 Tax=Tritrichomonas foetus TaxID=1144522 RepID=A0A1J4JKS8_9EUKA|nr:hypothetical protein TRFO_08339 [Tritrichomonas foetus]|eukprot:OHS99690.1 hypothetical protein TRFO_08339 [Tritrichomonas foetus]
MSNIRELTDRFASTLRRWGLNPREVFEEYDRGKTGYLLPEIFSRALVSTNFYCSVEDGIFLQNMYMENGMINYRRFLDDVANPISSKSTTLAPRDQEKIIEFGTRLQAKNLTVIDLMHEFDRLRVGHVSIDTFFRAFGSNPLCRSIANQYADTITGEVNYMSLHKDIQELLLHKSTSVKGPSCPLPPFFENFVRCISSRNINLYDSFAEYDRYKRGYITLQIFLSVVSSFGIPLSPSQLQQIAHPFVENGNINYKNFSVYVNKMADSFEVQPQQIEIQPTDLNKLLNEIKQRVVERRIQLRDQLQTAEHEARGNLSRQKFYKLLSFTGFNFSPGDIKSLDAAFVRRNDCVNVGAFLDRVDPMEPKVAPINVDEIIRRLRLLLLQRNESIVKYCASFDREQSGTISLSQLISVFNSIDFHPSTNELNAIGNKFGNGRFIQWKNLCDQVEPVIEKPSFTSTATSIRQSLPQQPAPPNEMVIALLRKLYQAAKRWNTSIRDDLIRLDIRKCGLLNSRTFREELESLPLKISSAEIMMACKNYFKPNTDQVCYLVFCDDLEQYGSIQEDRRDEEEQALLTRKIANENNLEDAQKTQQALRIIKAAVNSRRLSPEELFVKKDSYHTGLIPNDCVIPSLSPIILYLNEQQINQIMKDFRDRRQPEKFNYRRMCAALSDVTPRDEDIRLISEIRRQASGENDGVQFVTNELKNKLAERKKSVYDLFFDVNIDTITPTQFRNRIEQTGIIVPENDMQKLIRKYRATRSNEINWYAFCHDVEESQPMQYQSYH